MQKKQKEETNKHISNKNFPHWIYIRIVKREISAKALVPRDLAKRTPMDLATTLALRELRRTYIAESNSILRQA